MSWHGYTFPEFIVFFYPLFNFMDCSATTLQKIDNEPLIMIAKYNRIYFLCVYNDKKNKKNNYLLK